MLLQCRYLRLDGGAAEDDGTLSSASRDRLRLRAGARPRFAADMLGCNGELASISKYIDGEIVRSDTSLGSETELEYQMMVAGEGGRVTNTAASSTRSDEGEGRSAALTRKVTRERVAARPSTYEV